MMQKAWRSIEEVSYCFCEVIHQISQSHGRKNCRFESNLRLLGRSQLSNPSDLPCSIIFRRSMMKATQNGRRIRSARGEQLITMQRWFLLSNLMMPANIICDGNMPWSLLWHLFVIIVNKIYTEESMWREIIIKTTIFSDLCKHIKACEYYYHNCLNWWLCALLLMFKSWSVHKNYVWVSLLFIVKSRYIRYHQTSSISTPKSPNLNVSCLILQLSLPNLSKPGIELRMKM